MKPFNRNPRKISDKQLSDLKRSEDEFGDIGGILHNLPTDELIGGNQRVKSMGLEGATPIITKRFDPPTETGTIAVGYVEHPQTHELFAYRAVNWDADKCRRANIQANALGGDWDWQIISQDFKADELATLGLGNDALAAMNEGADALGKLLAPEPIVETADAGDLIDRADELQNKWKVQCGDLWQCGKHRILCGDSTNADDVARVMQGERAQMVFTDPPYGVDYDGGTKIREKLSGDNSTNLYQPCCDMAFQFSDDKSALYLWHAGIKGIAAAAAAAAAGYEIRCEIVWNKNQAQYGALSAQYKQKHEPCYYCYKRGKTVRWFGATNEVTVWDIDRASVNEFHPTQKPPELAVRAINNNSETGDTVLDLFLGSASTLVACEQTGRNGRGIEIEPKYVAVTLERLSLLGLECKRIA